MRVALVNNSVPFLEATMKKYPVAIIAALPFFLLGALAPSLATAQDDFPRTA
jgi:hypothetical protein